MRLFLLLAALCMVPVPALASGPVAIVEDIAADHAGIGPFEYVDAGRIIDLGAAGRLVIGYLKSCVRETVTGGRVTVEAEKSRIEGGTVARERVECDGGRLQLSLRQAGKSAVLMLRRTPGAGGAEIVQAAFRIYSTSPFIRLTGAVAAGTADAVEIERLDRPADVLRLQTTGGTVDLSARRTALRPGGLYRARAAGREVVFRVDRLARPGGPILSRLVGF